jgi:hypothetical protein
MYIYIFPDSRAEQDKRIAALEARVKVFDKVAEEAKRTTQRVDAIETDMHRFTSALETFLSRITIDDRLRLVPDTRHIEEGPSLADPVFPTTRSTSPTTPLEIPMDEDDGVQTSSVPDTRTTPSDIHPDIRMVDVGQRVSESAPALATPSDADISATVPASISAPKPAPALTLSSAVPPPPPTVAEEVMLPPHPIPRGRSRTPATGAALGDKGPTT